MIGVFLLIIFFALINISIFKYFKKKHSFFNQKKMHLLFIYHIIFYGIYLLYASQNRSDSHTYYQILESHQGKWLELFGTDTSFIHFLAFPFYNLGFNYEMLMLMFAWFGFLGFIFAYLFFRENIPVNIKVFNRVDLLSFLLFLPNMHFWTTSLGKGAPIFLGLMMFAYAIKNPKSRLFLLVLGSFIIFHIRPHVFMFVSVGAVLGYMSGKEKIPFWKKVLVYVIMIGTLVLVQDQILGVMGLEDSENLVEDFQAASSKNAEDLLKAGSGVDMSNYPLPLKLFTFWFRPLFIDAPNILGIIISFENLIYLLLFLKIIKKDFLKFILKSPSLVKMSLIIFLMASFAMTFIMSNLGIIMRQKSMVMYFIFFVIYYYLAQKKYDKVLRLHKWKHLRELESKKEHVSTSNN